MNTINGRTLDEITYNCMMYRLKRPNEWDEHCAGSLTLKGRVETAKWAYNYIQQLEAAQPKWISVEERLPDDRGNFITKIHCDNGDWIEMNTFDYMEKEWWHDAVDRTVKATEFVTHWMPIPEPPKEDCNEQ